MSEDPDLRAVQYVLGTLGAGERAAYERDRADDPKLVAAQLFWEERLASIAGAAPPVVPSAGLWAAIRRAPLPAGRWWLLGAALLLAASLVLLGAGPWRPPAAARAFAVLDRGGQDPALAVTVEPGAIRVRSLAAEWPRDGSLELWLIAPGTAPRSLGLIVPGPRTRLVLPAPDRFPPEGAALAVSVEAPGGSPTGGPTGAFVYRGRLIQE